MVWVLLKVLCAHTRTEDEHVPFIMTRMTALFTPERDGGRGREGGREGGRERGRA